LVFVCLSLLALAIAKRRFVRSVLLLIALTFFVLDAAMRVCILPITSHCQNSMQQFATALNTYAMKYGCYPPTFIADKNGRPMHSWRVLILPDLGYDSLYHQYNFNEPWDGPNNIKLALQMPDVFHCPAHDRTPQKNSLKSVSTSYLAAVGPKTFWLGEKTYDPKYFKPQQYANSILLVESADSDIVWTEPRDIEVALLGSASQPTVSSCHGLPVDYFHARQDNAVYVGLADASTCLTSRELFSGPKAAELFDIGGFTPSEHDLWSHRRLKWTNIVALVVWSISVGWLLVRAVQYRRKMKADK
jgi:hypothetical protein